MKRTTWKFHLHPSHVDHSDTVIVRMPRGSHLLRTAMAVGPDTMAIWAVVDPEEPIVERAIRIIGTGNPLHDDIALDKHVGTVSMPPFIWHVWDGGEQS